jgi:hypothetical protein
VCKTKIERLKEKIELEKEAQTKNDLAVETAGDIANAAKSREADLKADQKVARENKDKAEGEIKELRVNALNPLSYFRTH